MRYFWIFLIIVLGTSSCNKNDDEDKPISLEVSSIAANGSSFTVTFVNLNEDTSTITSNSFVIEDLGAFDDPDASSALQGISSVTSAQEFDGTHTEIKMASVLNTGHFYRLTHSGIFDFEDNLLITPPLEFATPDSFTDPDPDPDPDALTLSLFNIVTGESITAIPGTTLLAKITGTNFVSPMTVAFSPSDGLAAGTVTFVSATSLEFPLQIAPDGFGGLPDNLDFLDFGAQDITVTGGSTGVQTLTDAITPQIPSLPRLAIGSPLTAQNPSAVFLVPINAILAGLENVSSVADELAEITVEITFDPQVLTVALTGASGDGGTGLRIGSQAPFDAPFAFNTLRDNPPLGTFSSFRFTTVTNTGALPEVVNLATVEFTILSTAALGDSSYSVSVILATGLSTEAIDPLSFSSLAGLVTLE